MISMPSRKSKLVDQYGNYLKRSAERDPLMPPKRSGRDIRATYDAARTTDDFERYWANADQYDADSAHSRDVRETLVSRSRYEINNNGYADGIAQTYATDLIGKGPSLRMLTGSEGFNQMVEEEWKRWTKAIQFRRKLWCSAHAKLSDGEGMGVIRTNPNIAHPVRLDWRLYEAEQFQTPMLPLRETIGYIDGIRFDEYGNPTFYDLLRQHPGTRHGWYGYDMVPEQVPARFVTHWFLLRRPGQHRAVPEMASTLNTGAAARRWREATIGAAEVAAHYTVLLQTTMDPDTIDEVEPMTTMDIEKRMFTALPQGFGASQLKAEHPNATFEMFHRANVNEQARPKSMPFNKAACDSSDYNYASGRLDHQTYYGGIDVDREDCTDLVLDKIFRHWFEEAVRVFGWVGGNPDALSPQATRHDWDWPKHPVADLKSEAQANAIKLRTGQTTLDQIYSEAGSDFEDVIRITAERYGKTDDEIREAFFNLQFGQPGSVGSGLDELAQNASDEVVNVR